MAQIQWISKHSPVTLSSTMRSRFYNHSNMHLVQRFTSRFIPSPIAPIIRHDKSWLTQKDSHHLVQTKVSGSFQFVYLVVRGRLFEVQSGATGCSTGGTNGTSIRWGRTCRTRCDSTPHNRLVIHQKTRWSMPSGASVPAATSPTSKRAFRGIKSTSFGYGHGRRRVF